MSDLERDVAFLAQIIRDDGYAEPSELARLHEIAARYPRFAPRQDEDALARSLYPSQAARDAVAEVEP